MKIINYNNIKLQDLENIAKEIVSKIFESEKESLVMYLEGDMGAGKTTLAQNIGKALGVTDHMQSPTFTLMREYELFENKYSKLLHIDAYRFEDKKEGHVLKLNENKIGNVVVIEWPKNMYAPDAEMIINIEKVDEDTRNIKVEIL
jgi:tRNA threonylcarbamoyladenosine biosynthesis protein TsaE